MPSDSNGVYSLPSGYLAVTGETIQASQHNPPLEDLASAMTARMTRSGAAPMTGALKIVDGSAGSPSVQFVNGSSTGIYKTVNGIGFSIAGTQVAELVSGGFVKGGHFLGELIPYTGLTAQDLTVLPYGQTLSRTTYAALWAFAQVEIAAGNTAYNNGDGSTTFGVCDMRGRVPAGKDDMGGTAAGRLTTAGSSVDGLTVGAAGGSQSVALTEAQLAAHTHGAGTFKSAAHSHTYNNRPAFAQADGSGGVLNLWQNDNNNANTGSSGPHTVSGTSSSAGSGDAHNNVQPTLVCNYLLFAGA